MTSDNGDTSNNNGNGNTNIIALELTEEIKREQIVTSFVFDKRIESLRLSLNHKYNQKIIISPIEENWPKTIETFKKQLKLKGVNEDHVTQL